MMAPWPALPPLPHPRAVYGSLDFDRDYVAGCHALIKQLKLENNVALRGLGAPIKVGRPCLLNTAAAAVAQPAAARACYSLVCRSWRGAPGVQPPHSHACASRA
jgi:hypothetical protein